MRLFLSILICGTLIMAGFTTMKNSPVVDYLNLPGPISFMNSTFSLAWSSNPNASYFKQEYIPSGESVERFNQMIIVDVLYGSLSATDAVKSQIAQIDQRKKTDAVARYQLIENPENGEYILDFMMSSGNKKALDVVEWNAYRYKNIVDKEGRKGVLMFGISKRGYGEQITSFFTSLKSDRTATVNALGIYTLPEIEAKR